MGDENLGVPPVINVVCYSYKGGSGRSTAAVNIAFELARQGYLVALLDMDVDAPGQHMLMLEWLEGIERRREQNARRISVSGISAGEDEKIRTAIKRIRENRGTVGLQTYFNAPLSEAGTLDLLEPATLDMRQVDPAYLIAPYLDSSGKGQLEFFFASTSVRAIRDLEKGTYQGLQDFLERYGRLQQLIAQRLVEKAIDTMGPDDPATERTVGQVILVVDAPNGINPVSLPLLKSADLVLTFFRHSVQHVAGTIETVVKLHEYLRREFQRRFMRILLVGSCFPEELRGAVDSYLERERVSGYQGDLEVQQMQNKFLHINEQLMALERGREEVVLLADAIPETPLLKLLEQPIVYEGLPFQELFPGMIPPVRDNGNDLEKRGISSLFLEKIHRIAETVGLVSREIAMMKRGDP